MRDPVIDPDGNSCGRATIVRWLQEERSVSPLIGNPLFPSQLTTNRDLRAVIERYEAAITTQI
jgi:hypothetical protein